MIAPGISSSRTVMTVRVEVRFVPLNISKAASGDITPRAANFLLILWRCCEVYKHPHIVACGHSFCTICLLRYTFSKLHSCGRWHEEIGGYPQMLFVSYVAWHEVKECPLCRAPVSFPFPTEQFPFVPNNIAANTCAQLIETIEHGHTYAKAGLYTDGAEEALWASRQFSLIVHDCSAPIETGRWRLGSYGRSGEMGSVL